MSLARLRQLERYPHMDEQHWNAPGFIGLARLIFEWKKTSINNLLLFQQAVNIINRLLAGIKINICQIRTVIDA